MIGTSAALRLAASALILAVTLVMSFYALSLRADPGVESMIPAAGGDVKLLRRFHEAFGSDEIIVLAVRSETLFTAEKLRQVDELTRRAAALPHVARVLSPTNARDLDGDELGPYSLVPYERAAAGGESFEELARRLASHPLFGGLLVSADSRTAAILVEIAKTEAGGDPRAATVRQVRRLAEATPAGLSAYVAGLPVEKVDVAAYVEGDQRTFAPIIFGMLALIMAVLYRRPAGVIVPLGVVAASLLWTLGLYGMAGRSLNPVTSLLTPVVLVVSVEGAIHLLNHHMAARSEGLPRMDALRRAWRRARGPCFNAALTTAIGFVSLVLLPIPAIRDFGLFTAAGVLISYLLTMSLAPLLLAWLPDVPPRAAGVSRPGAAERALKAIAWWVCRRPLAAAAAAVAVLVASGAGVARVRVETDLIRSLRPGSPLYQATMFIDRHLTGVNSLEILIAAPSPEDLAFLRRVAAFEDEIRGLPGVRKVTGLPDLYARVNRAFHGGEDVFETLPEGPGAAEDLAAIRELLRDEAPQEVSRFVSADGVTLRLSARVTAMDTAASQEFFRRVRDAAARAGLPSAELTGSFAVLSNMSTSLVRNQVKGLAPALVLILTAMAIQFRSIRLGLLSALPNGAPVLMVYGLMGWTGIALSVPTAMIASIALGMTVDSTIHLLARFRQEFRRGGDYVEALGKMIDASGRPVVFSAITLALGFWVGAFSSFLPSVHFAVLTGAALLLGLASEAVLLPLALVLFRPLGKAAAAALLLLALAPGAGHAATAREILLKDQLGKTDGPGLHRGKMVLLLYGRASGLRRMKAWELKVVERTGGGLDVLRAVDARSLRGRKTEAEVGERLQRSVPPEISILIDWDGALAKAYAIPDVEVSVAVIDPRGTSCGAATGAVEPGSLESVLDIISRVREKGTCP